MITIEKTDVYGWEAAIRGMRNPMNSWDKSDSSFGDCDICLTNKDSCIAVNGEQPCGLLGENDLKLMKSLSKAGSDHGKFLRMITVTADITAPMYWLREFDTYKVGTVANSCSTMHKIHAKEFELDDFSVDHLNFGGEVVLLYTIDHLNKCRKAFLETKDKEWWWQMIQLLPSSYNQKRTVQLNYQVLKAMYHARKNHKLDEWHTFCEWIEGLPYAELIVGDCNG